VVWVSVVPVGTKTVRDNTRLIAGNNLYIKNNMGRENIGINTETVRDHFWNVDPTIDGRHRFIKSPAFSDATGVPLDPVLGVDMNQVIYAKLKTSTESVAQQDVQPFVCCTKPNTVASPSDFSIMQLLGMRACVLVEVKINQSSSSLNELVIKYSHNVSSVEKVYIQSPVFPFLNTLFEGFQINFTNSLPSENYFVQGGAVSNSSVHYVNVRNGPILNERKNVDYVQIVVQKDNKKRIVPIQFWVICFGG